VHAVVAVQPGIEFAVERPAGELTGQDGDLERKSSGDMKALQCGSGLPALG